MMNKNMNLIGQAVIIGITINLVITYALKHVATPNQISPPNGASSLPFFDQLIHMFVTIERPPLTSSNLMVYIVYWLLLSLVMRFFSQGFIMK